MKKEQLYKPVTREDLIKELEQKKAVLFNFDLPRAQRLASKAYGTDKEEQKKRRVDAIAQRILGIDNQIEDLRKPKKGTINPAVLIATVAGMAAGLKGI